MTQGTAKTTDPRESAAATREMMRCIRDELASNRILLPALPEIAARAREAVADPAASAARMAKIIGADPALAARLLQVANTASYRGRAAVTSIQGAIARLGVKMVRNLVTALVMEQLYKVKLNEKLRTVQREVWKHSIRVAALSSVLASRLTHLPKDEALLGGLLHDVGKLPVLRYAETLPELLANDALLHATLDELHNEIGALLLTKWELPDALVQCALHHGQVSDTASSEVALHDIVTLANICSHSDRGASLDEPSTEQLPVLAKLAIDSATLAEILREGAREIREVEQLLG